MGHLKPPGSYCQQHVAVTLISLSRIWMQKPGVVASRDAMLKKRQTFYIGEEEALLYPGRIRSPGDRSGAKRQYVWRCSVWKYLSGRVIWPGSGCWMPAKNFRLEILSVMVNKVDGQEPEHLSVEVDAKTPTANLNKDNLQMPPGRASTQV